MNITRTSVLLPLAVILLIGGVIAVGATSERGTSVDQAPPINVSENPADEATTTSAASPQQYTVIATSEAEINRTELSRYGTVGTQADTHVDLRMEASNVSAVEQLPWVTDVRPALSPAPANVPGSSDGDSLGVERLHQQGITGDGVKVGIIDLGFDFSEINGNVQTTVSFRDTPGDTTHGTAVAQTVVRTAPESQLYLASADTGTDHQRAIDYLTSQDVDIIVYSIGWPAIEDDGDHFLTDNIASARQQGVLFIASAGNEAERHWEGDFQDTDGDTLHEWGGAGDEQNALPSTNTIFSGGDITVYIRWEEQGDRSRYRTALYNPDTEQYVAAGEDRAFSVSTNKWSILDTTVSSQPLALVIENTAGPADDEIEVVFSSGPRAIERNIPASSVGAPADVPTSVSTGAYVREQGMASYSSRGPTDDGRRGVDVTGYTNIGVAAYNGRFAGTSAAAPYVGGVAALIEDRHSGDASPAEAEAALSSTSDDIRQSGPDTVSGAGVVNAEAAVGSATTRTVINSGDRVFQGEDDIAFQDSSGRVYTTLTGVSGDAEGQVVSVPIPEDQTAGRYSADGTVNSYTVLVDQPRISGLKILNQNGVDITAESVNKANAANLTVAVEYNYARYEGVEITVEDPSTLEIQDAVITSTNPQNAAGIGTQTVTFGLDLSGQDPGTYTIIAAGSDDFDFRGTVTGINLTAQDNGGEVSGPGDLTGDGQAATDPDGDGTFEDVNGDGDTDTTDVTALFNVIINQNLDSQTEQQLDINGDGQTDTSDVTKLFVNVI